MGVSCTSLEREIEFAISAALRKFYPNTNPPAVRLQTAKEQEMEERLRVVGKLMEDIAVGFKMYTDDMNSVKDRVAQLENVSVELQREQRSCSIMARRAVDLIATSSDSTQKINSALGGIDTALNKDMYDLRNAL